MGLGVPLVADARTTLLYEVGECVSAVKYVCSERLGGSQTLESEDVRFVCRTRLSLAAVGAAKSKDERTELPYNSYPFRFL